MNRIHDADNFMRSLGLPEVYRVGGSVRAELTGTPANDPDYVVRGIALPDLGKRLMKAKTRPAKLHLRTGEQVGWIIGLRGVGKVDICLPRKERSTGPGRHDFDITVSPDTTIREDARRRDFTINALYRNLADGELLDPIGCGRLDLNQRSLRTTQGQSFAEDPLRILRALRFVSTLGFNLHPGTWTEMRAHAHAVTGLTARGVSGTAWEELEKLLRGQRPDAALRLGRDSGALGILLPELVPIFGHVSNSPFHDLTTDEHTFSALKAAAALGTSLRVRVALLFHDTGKPEVEQDSRPYYVGHEEASARLAREALTRLNVPKRLRDDVQVIIRRHMVGLSGRTRPAKVRQWRCEVGDELLRDIFVHRLADVLGKDTVSYEAIQSIQRLESIREEAENMGVPTSPRELAVTGKDAMEKGLKGPAIGEALRKLLHEVVSQPDERRLGREWQLGRLGR